MKLNASFAPRLFAGFGTLTLLAGIGLLASRPAHSGGGPVFVNVANTPLATVLTDEAAPRQPFQGRTRYVILNGQVTGTLNTAFGWTDITVPAGKRLVVQTVTVEESQNGDLVNADISPQISGDSFGRYALPHITSTQIPFAGATQAMTFTADPDTTLPLIVSRLGSSGTMFYSCTVYGYLVNS